MNTIDIDTMTIDQLKADFMSIMGEVVLQYGDNQEGQDGRAEEKDQVSVQTLSIRS